MEDSGSAEKKWDSHHEEPFLCTQPNTQLLISWKREKPQNNRRFFAFGPEEHKLQPHQVAAAAVEVAVGLPATGQSKQEVLRLPFLWGVQPLTSSDWQWGGGGGGSRFDSVRYLRRAVSQTQRVDFAPRFRGICTAETGSGIGYRTSFVVQSCSYVQGFILPHLRWRRADLVRLPTS